MSSKRSFTKIFNSQKLYTMEKKKTGVPGHVLMLLEFSDLKVFMKERFKDINKRLSNLEDVVRKIPENLTAAIP